MKKFIIVFLTLMFCQRLEAAQEEIGMNPTPSDARYEQMAKEATRNRELLEIWKEHVRTLTKERDDFAKQLDVMKTTQNSAVHFGQVETQPIPQPAAVQPDTDALRIEIASDFQSKLDAAGSENQQLQRELQETQNDKNALILDKEQALRQVETLSEEIASLKNEIAVIKASSSSQVQSNPGSEKLSLEINKLQQTNEALEKDLRSKNDQIQELRSNTGNGQNASARLEEENARTKALEKSFAESRIHLNTVIDDLKKENQRLKASVNDASRVTSEKQDLDKSLNDLKAASVSREAELQELKQSYNALQKDWQSKRDEIADQKSQIVSLSERAEQSEKEVKSFQNAKTELESEITHLKSDLQMAKEENDNRGQEMQTVASKLKAEIQIRDAEKEDARQTAAELKKKSEENESLKAMIQHQLEAADSYAALEKHSKQQVGKLQTLSTVASQLKEENAGLQSQIAEQSKTIQTLRSSLGADLSDMQNLKSNVESYLESLSLSFEKRQK